MDKNAHLHHLNFGIFHQFLVLVKLTCLVTLFERKPQVFKNSPKLTIFGIFNWLLSTQNVNVARFALNVESVERDFFCGFQTPCRTLHYMMDYSFSFSSRNGRHLTNVRWKCERSVRKSYMYQSSNFHWWRGWKSHFSPS